MARSATWTSTIQYISPLAGNPTTGAGVQIIHDYAVHAELEAGAAGCSTRSRSRTSGSITPRFDISYQSSLYTNAVNGPYNLIKGYALANARLTWRSEDEKWQASLEVTNLFDKYYYLTSFDLHALSGTASAAPGRPREWAITVRRSF